MGQQGMREQIKIIPGVPAAFVQVSLRGIDCLGLVPMGTQLCRVNGNVVGEKTEE